MNTTTSRPSAAGDAFSLSRWYACLRYHMALHGRMLLLSALVMLALYVTINLLIMVSSIHDAQYAPAGIDQNWNTEEILYGFMLFIGMALAGSMFYASFHSKGTRLHILTLPATQAEKFAVSLLVYFILPIIAIPLIAFIGDWIRVGVLSCIPGVVRYVGPIPFHTLMTWGEMLPMSPGAWVEVVSVYLMALGIQSWFVLGSIYVPRLSLVITACAGWTLSTVAGIVAYVGKLAFFGGSSVRMAAEGTPTWGSVTWVCVIGAVIICGVYALSFWRMRQTEIANRW